MQNLIAAIIIIIIYFSCFVLEDFKTIPNYAIKIENQNEGIVQKTKSKNIKRSRKNKRKKKIKEIKIKYDKPKNFSYPNKITKGSFTLYTINPLKYNSPSNLSRVEPCRLLKEKINSANKYVYFAIYGIDNQNEIINSFLNAAKKNIEVKGVADSNESGEVTYYDMNKLKNKINITYDNSKYLVHDKFFVIDDNFVFTGSMNISKTGCGGYNANTVAIINDNNVASAFKNEFIQMHNGIFKNKKKDCSTSFITLEGGVKLAVIFLPQRNIYSEFMASAIEKAKSKIRVSLFVITRKDMVQKLKEAAKRGVDVRIIADAAGVSSRKKLINDMRENGIKIKVENFGGKNHEKTLSIDEDILIVGSANFSYSAMDKNDENALVIKDKDISEFYNGFFDALYNSLDDKTLSGFPNPESPDSYGSCTDGIDNDFDGKKDMKDTGCKQ